MVESWNWGEIFLIGDKMNLNEFKKSILKGKILALDKEIEKMTKKREKLVNKLALLFEKQKQQKIFEWAGAFRYDEQGNLNLADHIKKVTEDDSKPTAV